MRFHCSLSFLLCMVLSPLFVVSIVIHIISFFKQCWACFLTECSVSPLNKEYGVFKGSVNYEVFTLFVFSFLWDMYCVYCPSLPSMSIGCTLPIDCNFSMPKEPQYSMSYNRLIQ